MRRLVFIFFLSFVHFSAYSQVYSLEDAVKPQIAKLLRETGQVFQYGRAGLDYLDAFNLVDLKTEYEELYYKTSTNYTEQILYFVPNGLLPKRTDLQVYNAVKNVESLEQSYVVRDKRRDPFMSKVHEFATTALKQRVKYTPLEVPPIPIYSESYIKAKDTRFGTIGYTISYRYNKGRLIINLSNLSSIHYMVYPIADAQKFSTIVTVQPLKEGTLYIFQTFASLKNLKNAESNIDLRTFFSRRLEALKGWYFRQVYQVEVVQGVFPESIRLESKDDV